MNRDLRATLREFLTLKYGLTYDQCVEISEDFSQFLIDYQDSSLIITSSNGAAYDTYTFANRFTVNGH